MKKREREREGEDDGGGAQQGKRAARVGESSEANGDPPRLTTDDALQYLKDVKEKFKDDKEKYNEFLEVMKDFKAHRVDTAGVIKRVKELFKGHRYLILGFNAFLPPGFEITLPVEERKQQPPLPSMVQPPPPQQPQQLAVEFDQAINYVNKIKARFHADEHVYKAFLEILNMYRRGNKNINEVYQEVALLFANHSDLLQEFTYFLPGTSNGATSHHQEHHHYHPPAPPPMASIKPGLQPQRPREIAFGKPVSNGGLLIAKKEKIVGVPSRDREAERRAEKSRKGLEKKDIGDRKEGIDRVEGGREKEKDFFEQKPKRASARNATDAIRRQSQAGEGGEGFSGPGVQVSMDDSKVKGAALQYPIFDKVKSRLRNRDTYQEFLKCLNIFSQEIISRVELQSLVGDILGKHADLLEGFNEFLTHCENVEGYLAGVFSERKLGDFAEGAPLKVVKTERDGERDRNREKDRERDRERRKERERERLQEKTREREKVIEREKEKLREKERERDRSVKDRERDHGVKDVAHKVSQKDKFVNKPISELDLSNCERCTPSYRLLPKQYPKPVSSHRTALGISVLNDNWVSVTSGSEDYSLKNSRKNQHEESLFRCEDDRYELDMLLETTAATAKLVGQYTLKQDGESGKAEALLPLEEFLSPIHLRCIERIYGDHGLDILEVMKKSTSRAMPVIHSRLVQKEEEWTKCREEMNKVWSEVYTKNVYKALDHRSFNFKQQDRKTLSVKSLLADIKEMNENEKRRREDDAMLAIAAGNRRPLSPDFLYKFGDASIHDDLYKIMQYSSKQISTAPGYSEKIMRSFRMVQALMLGVSLRRHCEENMEEASNGKGLDGNAMESGGGSEGDETSSPEGGGGGLGSEKGVVVSKNVENIGVERSRARILGGSDGNLADGFQRNVGECLVAENADIGVSDQGSEGANEVFGRDTGSGDAEGTAARTEGSGWLHAENSGRKQSSLAGERSESEARINDGLVPDGNVSGVRDTVDREEGELSPSSELEDRNKVKYGPRGMGLEENGVKIFDHEEVDAEAVGVTDMDHDQDANDKREATTQKSSEDSDNPSEGADESSASEQSSDELSEHEEEEDEQEEKVESEGEAEGMADADDGDEDGNSSLATQAHAYAHCKPLAVHPASATASLAASHNRAAGRVFYGNDSSYILSRLYQLFYERIRSAKANAELTGKKKCSDGGTAPNLYSRFIHVLFRFLDGSVCNSIFEDECRDIIGTQSYLLFTLDRLIFKLVKHLQMADADEGVQKLLALNAYEYEREAVDLVYYADACVVLHDENLYRFENRLNSSELLIQLMEIPEKLDFPGNALGSPFQKYLDEFTKSAPTRKNPIVRRILKQKYSGEEQDTVIERALLNTKVVNGLENKISCRTSKVSYVLDTEDLFLRLAARRFRRFPEHKQKWQFEKKKRFGDWLEKDGSKLSDSASESSISR